MLQKPMSLRTLLSFVMVAVAGTTLLVSAFLVVLTTQLRRTNTTLGDSVESLHLVDEITSDLLVYDRSRDPRMRDVVARRLQLNLIDANHVVSTPQEAGILAATVDAIERYLAISSAPDPDRTRVAARLEESYKAVQDLVGINLSQAREARDQAATLGRFAQRLGLGIALLVVVVVGVVVGWLRTRAFAPVFALVRAMDRFEEGERDARAPESGAIELRAMARRFNEMADAISRRRQNQMAFLAGVAHDLRNPLSALRMSTASMQPGRPLPPEPTIRRIVELIDRQLLQIERMVGDFIDTARIEAGQLELRLAPCDLRPIVRHSVELFQSTSSEDRFDLTLPNEEVVTRCDPVRLDQVVTNLISNAAKYSPDTSRIAIVLSCERDEAVLAVSDHGIGIADEDLRRVFEPFRRTGAARESYPGVGLGLFVVRRIVQAHGGRIEVDSARGRGSTFRVRLPALRGAELAASVAVAEMSI
jgi:two-component system, OmpR family, sensor histidine kinase MtrB